LRGRLGFLGCTARVFARLVLRRRVALRDASDELVNERDATLKAGDSCAQATD
jgi:hypothetical protein